MPNLIGMTQEQADRALSLAGVRSWSDTLKATTTYAVGTVVAEDPAAGTAVGSSSAGEAVPPVNVTIAKAAALPAITMGIKGAEVIVPLTTRIGPWEFRPIRGSRGKLRVEYACAGTGNFSLAIAGTKVTDTCDGQPHIYGDDSAVVNLQANIIVTTASTTRWHIIAIADK